MVAKPSQLPEWASSNVVDPVSGQNNVLEPPPEKKTNGWNRLEKPARNWFNWLGRVTHDWLAWLDQQEDQSKVTDGDGVGLFLDDGALITLYAVDSVTPANYVVAMGYKGAGAAPSLNVIDSNTLTLGTGTISGNQPISGGTAGNIIVYGQSKLIP